MDDPFEIPSIEEIEEMERQRSQAIESLQVTGNSVKCHRCGNAIPIVGKMAARNDRIAVLQKQIKWIEEHYQYPHRPYGNIGNNKDNNNIKQLKQNLAELLEEDA